MGAAHCATCHVGGDRSRDVNDGKLHAPSEVGQSAGVRRAQRDEEVPHDAAARPVAPPQLQGPYFHDGSAATLEDVVAHYVPLLGLALTAQQKADLVTYLKSL